MKTPGPAPRITDEQPGLYRKYRIIKCATNEEVDGPAFVLRLDRDPHARAALKAYAESCWRDNPALALDIDRWLQQIESEAQS